MAEIKFYQDAEKTNQVYPEINPDGIYPGVTVGLADNLTSEEGVVDTDEWQLRTTGGELDVSDGYATLRNLIGSTESSTVEESLTYNLYTTGITAITTNLETFKTQISNSGFYNFTYVPIISYTSDLVYHLNEISFATATSQTAGTYTFTYQAEIVRQDPSSLISTFNTATFISKVDENPSNYTFIYDGTDWKLNDETVTLSQYGITISGTLVENSTFTIVYAANNWYYNSSAISMGNYGITTTGTEHVGDTITITYTGNQWQLTYGETTVDNISLATYGITVTTGTASISDLIQVTYTAEEIGAIVTSHPYYIHSLGLNLFDVDNNSKIFSGYKINDNGEIVTESNNYVIFFKAPAETYTIKYFGTTTLGNIGYIATIPTTSSTVTLLTPVTSSDWADTLVNNSTTKHVTIENEGYICVSTPLIEDLCCHLTWEGIYEDVYESYTVYDMAIPYTDDNGSIIRNYGLVNLDSTTTYYDEIDFVGGKWYQRTDRMAYSAANLATVQALNVPYLYDSNYIYYGIDTIVHTLPDASSDYKMSNYGIEELVGTNTMPCQVEVFYQENLKDKLRFSAEVIDNKVTSLSDSNTDDQYPSALCVQKYFNGTSIMDNIVVNDVKRKNLFDESQLLNANGWSINSSGYYNGTFVNWYLAFREGFYFNKNFKENTRYTISLNGYVSGDQASVYVKYTDGSQEYFGINNTSPSNKVFTSASGKTISSIVTSYSNDSNAILYIKNMQIEEGTSATTYAPYQKLLDEKTIKDKDMVVKTIQTKNLFNKSQSTVESDGARAAELNTGIRIEVTVAGPSKYVVYRLSDELLGKTITISANMTRHSSESGSIRLFYGNGSSPTAYEIQSKYASSDGLISMTQTFPTKASLPSGRIGIYLLVYAEIGNNGVVGNYIDYENFQIELGGQITDYAPFQGLLDEKTIKDKDLTVRSVHGKNLFNIHGKINEEPTTSSMSPKKNVLTNYEGELYSYINTSSNYGKGQKFTNLKGKTFTVSAQMHSLGSSGYGGRIEIWDNGVLKRTMDIETTYNRQSFTYTGQSNNIVIAFATKGGTGAVFSAIQVELGTQMTEYVPYQPIENEQLLDYKKSNHDTAGWYRVGRFNDVSTGAIFLVRTMYNYDPPSTVIFSVVNCHQKAKIAVLNAVSFDNGSPCITKIRVQYDSTSYNFYIDVYYPRTRTNEIAACNISLLPYQDIEIINPTGSFTQYTTVDEVTISYS